MSGPRIAVVGAGANGAGVGADLTRAGHDVTLVEQWPDHVEAMRAGGVRSTCDGRLTVTPVEVRHLCEVATLRDPFDVVLVLVKAYDTRWAVELIKPLVADDGVVVGLQNGMSIDDVLAVMGPERSLGGVIEMGGNMYRPGEVTRDTPPERTWFAVGSDDPVAQAKAAGVAELLGAAGTAVVSDDIRADKWMKLILNAAELVPSSILGISIVEAARIPEMRELMLEAGREAIAAAATLGHRVRPIIGMSDVDPDQPERFLTDIFDLLLTHYALPDSKATVLQDWVKRRRSEVDQINGLVVDVLAAAGRPAPVNAAATALAHRIEAHELDPSLTLLPEFAAAARG
ncbi:MAG: hypothetical protein J0G30_00975 [Actinomycetales bacterium]|nr:hypothetical protein [Actinomycetales bacterium]